MGFLDDLEHLIELELGENIQILELRENIRIVDVLTKLGFFAFLALTVALKVNHDLEFEISGLCSLCRPILRYMYSCLGHFGPLSKINLQKKEPHVDLLPQVKNKDLVNYRSGVTPSNKPTANGAPHHRLTGQRDERRCI